MSGMNAKKGKSQRNQKVFAIISLLVVVAMILTTVLSSLGAGLR